VEGVEGTGHFLPQERPQLIAERAKTLFTSVPASEV
jgi:hypothetical protein